MSSPPAEKSAGEPWTVGRIIDWTTAHLRKHGSESPRLEAEILLAHARKQETPVTVVEWPGGEPVEVRLKVDHKL